MKNFVEYLYSKFLQSDGISIDTRTVEQDNLFFALKGPNFNGNKYAAQALEKGAAFAVVDEEAYANDPRIILVEDALKALQELATFHRSRYKRKLLALTGSNGKTTSKELIHRVLGKKYIVYSTRGNLNNHIGVPITLLHIHPQVEVAVIEMGANHVGEIANLCSIANPNYGLITNIGEAHTETFGGIEGVLRGKSELFDHLRKTGGIPFIYQQDHRLANMNKRFSNAIHYPEKDLKMIGSVPYLRISLGGKEVQTRLVGTYNFGNIASAVAVGRAFQVPDEDILEAVSTYTPDNQRSEIIEKGKLRIINDSYNANPTSMKVAIENLALSEGKKVAILGEMKEVQNSPEKHRELGRTLKDAGIDEVLLLGPDMKHAGEEVNSVWFADMVALKKHLNAHSFKEGTVLLKASRSIKLESIIEDIT